MSTTGFWGIGGLKGATFNWDIAPLFKNNRMPRLCSVLAW